ncbi:MAG: phospho-sugar mutase [Spirochaetaceae bacterium]|jgi:phosphoglucomutase|nr:phospho-sugar mutase [Spirochaetaceae bacterium]
MEKQDIISKAKEYVAKEKETRFREEVEALLAAEDFKELEDRFYKQLEFGTGGLRGVIGGGYNRMNTLVVKSATQGLAAYLVKTFPEKASNNGLSAVIAFDSRHYSVEFAEGAALVLAANGIKTYLFSSMRPTPELSFAIRTLKADTGIVVTASHNPPKYNGYKAYWNDGSQVIEPHDTGIIDEVNAVTEIKEIDKKTALDKGLLKIIDKEIDEPFQNMIRAHLFRPELIKEKAKEVKIVYTPLHGTGAMHVESVLGSLGLDILTVPEQRDGNGDFPTVDFPNPEEPPALKMAIDLGKKSVADVVMATDPDADRFGIAVPSNGEFVCVTGNQLGSLLIDYVCLSLKETGKMPANPAFINSIVTTGMQERVAELYGVKRQECLTGFKWIADVMRKSDEGQIPEKIVFGTEESYGFLVENEVRDKDGISAAAMTAEMTLYWRSKGKSLLERLDELYEKCGCWVDTGISKYFQGPKGQEIMAGILAEFRKNPPKTLGGIEVKKVRDIEASVSLFPHEQGKKEPVDLPKSNVLQFYLKDGTIVSARPSGTEPKIKFYASGFETVGNTGLKAARDICTKKMNSIKEELQKVLSD